MEKTIVSYNRESGIVINCTQIRENEHKRVREEVEKLGFEFDSIDADSFSATRQGDHTPQTLEALENLDYSF